MSGVYASCFCLTGCSLQFEIFWFAVNYRQDLKHLRSDVMFGNVATLFTYPARSHTLGHL